MKTLAEKIAKNRLSRACAVFGVKELGAETAAAVAPDFLRVDFTASDLTGARRVSFEARIANDFGLTSAVVQERPSTRNFVTTRPSLEISSSTLTYEDAERAIKYVKRLAVRIEAELRTDRPSFGAYVSALAVAAGFSQVRVFNEPGRPTGTGFVDVPVAGLSTRLDRGLERHLNGAV